MPFEQLTDLEWIMLYSWVVVIVIVMVWLWWQRDPLTVFAPPMFLVIFNIYYCILGPLKGVVDGDTIDRGIDFRPDLAIAWFASLLSFLVTVLVFRFSQPRPTPPIATCNAWVNGRAWFLGNRINQLALLLYIAVAGTSILYLLNPFDAKGSSFGANLYTGAFANYLRYGINLLIPGISLMWLGWLKRRRDLWLVLVWVLVAFAIYTSLGFRYRIALLVGNLYLLYHFVSLRRPNIWISVGLCGLLILGAGYFVGGRTYGQGVDLSAVSQRELGDIVELGLHEASIFWTSAGVLRFVPSHFPFVGPAPVISTLLFPIPSGVFTSKDSARYLLGALASIYGGDIEASGAAIMGWAEWYLMAGWTSLVLCSAVFGWLYRWLWEWYLLRRGNAIAAAYYSGAVCFQYVIVSRGYMPQQAMLFCFTVLPLWFLYRRLNQRIVRSAVALSTGDVQQP